MFRLLYFLIIYCCLSIHILKKVLSKIFNKKNQFIGYIRPILNYQKIYKLMYTYSLYNYEYYIH